MPFHPESFDPRERERRKKKAACRYEGLEVGERNADGPEEEHRNGVGQDQDRQAARQTRFPGFLGFNAGIAVKDVLEDGIMISHEL